MAVNAITLLLFPSIMAFAASSDILTMRISNWFSLTLAAGFFALALLNGMGAIEILLHVSAGVTILILAFICFSNGWIGGGDAKLAAATGLWFGFSQLMDYLLIASLCGGALTILILFLRIYPLPPWLEGQEWVKRLHDKKSRIPYGVALAAAALFLYPQTIWMKMISM